MPEANRSQTANFDPAKLKHRIEQVSGVLIALVGLGEAGYLLYKQFREWQRRAETEEARRGARRGPTIIERQR